MSEYIVDVGSADAEHIAYLGVQATTVFGHPIGERVVRCRDCKYASYDSRWCYRLLNAEEPPTTPDGFCAWGERRNDV